MHDIRPAFNQLNIVSGDLDASVRFYRRLGVSIPDEGVWRTQTGAHHVSASLPKTTGQPRLELDSTVFACLWNTGWQGRADIRGRVVVGFGVGSREEVDRLHAEMTGAGYRSLQAPHDAFWGSRYAVIEDPDGLAVGLMSEMSAEHRSLPPKV